MYMYSFNLIFVYCSCICLTIFTNCTCIDGNISTTRRKHADFKYTVIDIEVHIWVAQWYMYVCISTLGLALENKSISLLGWVLCLVMSTTDSCGRKHFLRKPYIICWPYLGIFLNDAIRMYMRFWYFTDEARVLLIQTVVKSDNR